MLFWILWYLIGFVSSLFCCVLIEYDTFGKWQLTLGGLLLSIILGIGGIFVLIADIIMLLIFNIKWSKIIWRR